MAVGLSTAGSWLPPPPRGIAETRAEPGSLRAGCAIDFDPLAMAYADGDLDVCVAKSEFTDMPQIDSAGLAGQDGTVMGVIILRGVLRASGHEDDFARRSEASSSCALELPGDSVSVGGGIAEVQNDQGQALPLA